MGRSGIYGNYNRKNEIVDNHVPTKREVEIIQLRSEGLTYKEVGAKLGICEKTVSAHAYNINKKLNVTNSTQAFRKMVEIGYININYEDVPDQLIYTAIEKMLPDLYKTVKEEILNGRRREINGTGI